MTQGPAFTNKAVKSTTDQQDDLNNFGTEVQQAFHGFIQEELNLTALGPQQIQEADARLQQRAEIQKIVEQSLVQALLQSQQEADKILEGQIANIGPEESEYLRNLNYRDLEDFTTEQFEQYMEQLFNLQPYQQTFIDRLP